MIGGLFDWARALSEHVVRVLARRLVERRRDTLQSSSAVGHETAVSFSNRAKRREASEALKLSREAYENIVAEAVDAAMKDVQVCTINT